MVPTSLALLLALAAGPARAAEAVSGEAKPLAASGYLKELVQCSRSLLDRRPYCLSTSRARLTLDARAGAVRVHADYDHEVLAGGYFRTLDYKLSGLSEPPAWLTMEQTISTGPDTLWRHRLYRGWAGLEGEKSVVRFGRQRVAWGTGKFWSPTDVLNPFVPTSIERDERRGVDALYARQGLGTLSQVEAAWAPRDRWVDHALLVRARTNLADFDFSLLGGKVAASTASWMAGGDFAGNLAEGTLHGEWSYTDPRTRTPFWKAGLGYEYTFAADNRVWPLREAAVVAEYYHSGAGDPRRARYDFSVLRAGREVTVAQDYAGASYSKDLHPLLKLEVFAIMNLDDRSHFLSPSLQWNPLKDLYLSGGLQRFGGTRSSEFGRLPNIAYGQAQFYF